jgi:hypothetical protein
MFAYLGPLMASSPLQIDYIESVLSDAHGVVWELGPGNGDQTFHSKASIFEKIYGAEPNVNFHQALTSKAKEAGFGGNYIPFKAGAQPECLLPALQDAGILPPKMTQLPVEGIF